MGTTLSETGLGNHGSLKLVTWSWLHAQQAQQRWQFPQEQFKHIPQWHLTQKTIQPLGTLMLHVGHATSGPMHGGALGGSRQGAFGRKPSMLRLSETGP